VAARQRAEMAKGERQKKAKGPPATVPPPTQPSSAATVADDADASKARARRRPACPQLEREELLAVRLIPVLQQRVGFGPTQSGLGLNDGFISVAPENLLGVIRSVAAGAAPPATEMRGAAFQPTASAAPDGELNPPPQRRESQKRLGVPFEVWLPASPWPMRLATCILTVRFLVGIQIRGWLREAQTPEPQEVQISMLARIVLEVMGEGSSETLQDLAWTAFAVIVLLTLQELATFDTGLEQGWIEGSPFVLGRPMRLTREFRTNTSQHRIERLQLKARGQLGQAVDGLGHSERAVLVAEASAGLVYGPTLLTAGWLGCIVLLVGSSTSLFPKDESLELCAHRLNSLGFMGFGAGLCTFERAIGWAIGAGQIFARACLYLAVRLDEVKALCNRAGALQCLVVVEDIDDTLALQHDDDIPAASFTIRELMRLKKDVHDSKDAIHELSTAILVLVTALVSTTAWVSYRQPTSTSGIWCAAIAQLVFGSMAAMVLAALNEVDSALSSVPELVVKDFPPSPNKVRNTPFLAPCCLLKQTVKSPRYLDRLGTNIRETETGGALHTTGCARCPHVPKSA
jgi:hypothetical protein